MTDLNTSKLILVVDDDADICESLNDLLTLDGYQVITAPNGLKGLELARARQPRVILLDIMMPIMDGYEFLKHQREDSGIRDIPVIVLSAGKRLDLLPPEIPRLPKPPELVALFALIESKMNRPEPTPEPQAEKTPESVISKLPHQQVGGPAFQPIEQPL